MFHLVLGVLIIRPNFLISFQKFQTAAVGQQQILSFKSLMPVCLSLSRLSVSQLVGQTTFQSIYIQSFIFLLLYNSQY